MSDLSEIPFDADATEEMRTFECLPPGEYLAEVVETDVAATQKGEGDLLQLTTQWQIVEGEYAGRVFFSRISMQHPKYPYATLPTGKQQAIDIGNRARKSLELALLGRNGMRDSDELLGRKCLVRLKVRPEKNGYAASNEPTMFTAVEGANAVAVAQSPHGATQTRTMQPAASPARAAVAHAPVAAAGTTGIAGGRKPPWKK